jgi:hypothetical protein
MGWKIFAEKILEAEISGGQGSVMVTILGKFHDPLPGYSAEYVGCQLEWPRADCVAIYPCGRLIPASPPEQHPPGYVSIDPVPNWRFRITEHIPINPGKYNMCICSQAGETPGWQQIQIE